MLIARSPARRPPLPVLLGTAALVAGLPATTASAAAPSSPATPRAAAPAGAWTGTTTVSLRADAARRLGVGRLRVAAVGDASGRGRSFRLAVTGGTGGAALRAQHARTAGLRLTSARRSLKITDLRLTAGKRGQLSGRIDGGPPRALFGLGKATATRTGAGWRLRASALSPTASGARALRKALGGRRIGTQPIGTVETRLTPAPARDSVAPAPVATPIPAPVAPTTPAPTVPTPVPPTDPLPPLPPTPDSAWRIAGLDARDLTANGVTEWAIRGSWLRYLNAGKGSVVTSGVEQVDGGTYGFPARGGSYAPTSGWDLTHGGSVTFLYPGHGIEISLADPQVILGPTPRLSVVLTNRSNASGVPIGDGGASTGDGQPRRVDFGTLDLSAATPTVSGTTVSWERVPVLLTATGAEPFLAYKAGEAFGSISVRASTLSAR